MPPAKKKSKDGPDPEPRLPTRARILNESMRLFAEQGYTATTVAKIEEAAGLSPGSGALYRHFASKQEILIAGFADARARIEANRAASNLVVPVAALPADDHELTGQLRLTFDLVHLGMESIKTMLLAQMRGGADLPSEVHDAINHWLTESLNLAATNMRTRRTIAGSAKPAVDPLADAYILMAPLIWAKVIEWNSGSLPAGLTGARIRESWVRHWVAIAGERGDRSALSPKRRSQ